MTCKVFRPDHNGECLTCDEWMDAHTVKAIKAGEQAAANAERKRKKRPRKVKKELRKWLAYGDYRLPVRVRRQLLRGIDRMRAAEGLPPVRRIGPDGRVSLLDLV